MRRSEVEGFKLAGCLAMVRTMQSRRPIRTLALIGFALVALGLAGCGRKAPLDLPPSASAASAVTESKFETKSLSSITKPEKPKPRVVPQRSLPIDVLLE